MKNFEQIGTEIGELVEMKNAAYGSSFAKCGGYLRLLFPDGIPADRYEDVLLLARDFDKSMRIATHRDALGENPWADKTGYGILGVHLHQNTESEERCKGSACGQVAATSSSEKANGAGESAAASTQQPTGAPRDREPSSQPDGCSAELATARAPIATVAASPGEAAGRSGIDLVFGQIIELMRRCNQMQLCARCGYSYQGGALQASVWGELFILCRMCSISPTKYRWQHALEDGRP